MIYINLRLLMKEEELGEEKRFLSWIPFNSNELNCDKDINGIGYDGITVKYDRDAPARIR